MRAPPTHYYNLVGNPSSKDRLEVTVRHEHGLDELDGLKIKSFTEIFSQYRPNANIGVEWDVESCVLVVSWIVPETDEQYEQRLAWLKAEKKTAKKVAKKRTRK